MPRRVALATSDYALTSPVDADLDLQYIVAELDRLGVQCEPIDWLDETADWASYDLVVVKSPWDYASQLPRFLDWLASVEAVTTVRNHPDVIRWNLDKTYLGELIGRGIECVETTYCHTLDAVREAVKRHDRVVLKPTVSAASANTGLFESSDPAALDLAAEIFALDKVVMVQPAIESIGRVGERALVHLDSELAHTIRKGPLLGLGGGLLSDVYEEAITSEVAPDDEVDLARRALAAAAAICRERGVAAADARTLHARVDVARDSDDRPLILELELFEPSTFIAYHPAAAALYASAIMGLVETKE